MGNESFRFRVGTFECIIVSDGTFAYPHPAQIFFVNAPKERLERVLRKHSLDPEKWEQYVIQKREGWQWQPIETTGRTPEA